MMLTFKHSIIIYNAMSLKEILNMNSFHQKIKLDNSDSDFIFFQDEEKLAEEKTENKKFSGNEWNQEYELIYNSYVLEN